MKQKRQHWGKTLRLLDKEVLPPEDFAEQIRQVVLQGDEFTPQIVERSRNQLEQLLREKSRHLLSLAKNQAGIHQAYHGVFLFSVAQAILVNPDEDMRYIHRALNLISEAQSELTNAMLWLSAQSREILFSCPQLHLMYPREWPACYSGVLASARAAHALCRLQMPTRIANAHYDVFKKIDYFCEPHYEGLPNLCFQIKADGKPRGASFTVLAREPRADALPPDEYRLRYSVWDGVRRFNEQQQQLWLGVIARIGIQGVSITQVEDPELERLFEGFILSTWRHHPDPTRFNQHLLDLHNNEERS